MTAVSGDDVSVRCHLPSESSPPSNHPFWNRPWEVRTQTTGSARVRHIAVRFTDGSKVTESTLLPDHSWREGEPQPTKDDTNKNQTPTRQGADRELVSAHGRTHNPVGTQLCMVRSCNLYVTLSTSTQTKPRQQQTSHSPSDWVTDIYMPPHSMSNPMSYDLATTRLL